MVYLLERLTIQTKLFSRNFLEHIGGVYLDDVKNHIYIKVYFSIFCDG